MPSRVSTTEVERAERDVGAPGGVVEPPVEVGGEGVLAGVAPGAVAAVVAEGDGLGEGDVEAAGPGDAGGHLGHLEGVGQPGPLVVVGEDEHLGLAGQPPEGRGVQDPVAVALEAGPPRVGLLGPQPVAGAAGPGRPGGQLAVLVAPPRSVAAERPEPAAAGTARRARLSAWANVMPGPRWPAMVDAQPAIRCSRRQPVPCVWRPTGRPRLGAPRAVCAGVTPCAAVRPTLYRRRRPAAPSGRRAERSVPGGRADRNRADR